MSFYNNRYYYLNKTFLSIIGQWPFQSRLEGNVLLAITILFICSLTTLELLGLIAGITNLNIVMENSSPLFINSLIFVKLINSLCNKHKMKDLLENIEETWKMTPIGPESKILRNYAEQNRIFTIQYAAALLSSAIFYSTMPIVVNGIYSFLPTNENYTARFLYRLEHVLDVDKYFNLLMLHGIISIFYIAYKINRIRSSDFVILKPNIEDDEAYHVIIDCIKSYKHALKFSDLLSSVYATSFFFLLGIAILSLSFNAAELIMVNNQLDETIRIVSAIMGLLTHIFYLSLTSQRLIDHSSELQETIYSCEWYKISLRSRQLLRFTLMRAIKPCEIKAEMYVMSLENFSSLWGLIAGITDLSIIMENVSPLLVNSSVVIKLINFLYNKYKVQMKDLLEHIKETWKMMKPETERKILESYAERTRTLTIQYAIGIYSMGMSYATMPFVIKGIYLLLPSNETNQVRFLYRLEHVIDVNKYFNLLMFHG
ncbi:uncharacterized protein LOC109609791, partial [Camponotus floridanus]|uniref:uncharacterized protein LOC109609791 n=1 Tax=Camponotus floridanus TaxID=104421 RepID=UPI000DC6721D